MAKKKNKDESPELHKDLKGFEIRINEFGQIESSFPIDRLNEFLNRNTNDKKLRDQSESPEQTPPSEDK